MSKFSGLRSARESKKAGVSATQQPETPAVQNAESAEKRRPGRPNAKRSDPEFGQVTAYIRKTTYTDVKHKLLDQGNREFSELLEELLRKWADE